MTDDEKRRIKRRLTLAEAAATVKDISRSLEGHVALKTAFVRAINPRHEGRVIEALVKTAQGAIVDRFETADGRMQYQVEIPGGYYRCLKEGGKEIIQTRLNRAFE